MSDENVSISEGGGSLMLQLPAEHPPFDFTFLFPSSPTHDELKAHKGTLSSKCEFFRAMFSSGMADAQTDQMPIDDFSPMTMSHFLHYLCHGNLDESFCSKHFVELFKAASFFGCPDLCHFLLDSVNDLCTLCAAVESVFVVAWPRESISGHFRSFVVQHLGSLTLEDLVGLSKGALCVLTSVASHGMCWAVTIFHLMESWAHANGLKTLSLSLLELVPFERMWASEFDKHVETSSLVPKKVLPHLKSKIAVARDWSLLTGAPTLTFNHPFECCHGIALAPQQLPHTTSPSLVVYVTDWIDHTVHMFDGTTGQPISSLSASSFGSEGSDSGQFNGPRGIAVSTISSETHNRDDSSLVGSVFVCDYENHRVQVFSAMGVHKRLFGSSQLQFPHGLSIDHVRHEVHVCDCDNHQIMVFAESDGRHLFSYGSFGSDPGQLTYPTGVAVDATDQFAQT